jgi:hypothetical protein
MDITEKFEAERERHFKKAGAYDSQMQFRAERDWLYEIISAMEERITLLEAVTSDSQRQVAY